MDQIVSNKNIKSNKKVLAKFCCYIIFMLFMHGQTSLWLFCVLKPNLKTFDILTLILLGLASLSGASNSSRKSPISLMEI